MYNVYISYTHHIIYHIIRFAFNVTSPLVSGVDAGANLGQSGLNTLLAPCAASLCCIIWKRRFPSKDGARVVTIEESLGCILAGAVAITASCYTVNWWASLIIGFFVTPIFFFTNWFIREKLLIDDPLGVASVHLFPGFYGVLCEGIKYSTNSLKIS